MVEERQRLQNSEPAEEGISPVRIVVGFLLTVFFTVLLIPFLFMGACFGILAADSNGVVLVVVLAALATLSLLLLVAIKTKNPGVRWGIILILVVAAAIVVSVATKFIR